MYSSTYLNWFRRLLILGAVVAGLTATAAGAAVNSRPPDVSDVASKLSGTPATIVSRPPDVQDAATSVSARSSVPDVFERYAAAHPSGVGLSSASEPTFVGRPPDVRDAASALNSTVDIVRPPDIQDLAGTSSASADVIARHLRHEDALYRDNSTALGSPSTTPSSGGFDWSDYAIGLGSGMGLALLLGVGLVVARQHRHRVQPA
jgi:hypothetical protein